MSLNYLDYVLKATDGALFASLLTYAKLGSVDNHASQMTAAVNATKDENRSASLS